MQVSPCHSVVEVKTGRLSGQPASPQGRGDRTSNHDRQQWRPDTWLVEPGSTAGFSKRAWQTRTLFPCGMKLEKISFRAPFPIPVWGVSGGVKGQDDRQRTAPLTPPLTPTPLYALTADSVVIHLNDSAQTVVFLTAQEAQTALWLFPLAHQTGRVFLYLAVCHAEFVAKAQKGFIPV